jgi:protein SCO1/2
MSKTSSDPKRELLPVAEPFGVDRRIFIAACASAVAVMASLILTWYTAYRKAEAKFYGQALVPPKEAFDFHLVDQDGKPFQLSQLRGKVVLFDFGFTHCPNVCPTTVSYLAKVYRALPVVDRSKVQILFISVDPRRDRPEVLKEYLPYFDASFVGLTGNDDEIAEIAKAYGAFYETVHNPGDPPDVYSVNHSTYTYLLTADGKWKLLYDFDQLRDTEKIVTDIQRVLASS